MKSFFAAIGSHNEKDLLALAFKDDWVFDMTIRDGKVATIREYIDTQAMARASETDH